MNLCFRPQPPIIQYPPLVPIGLGRHRYSVFQSVQSVCLEAMVGRDVRQVGDLRSDRTDLHC